MPALEGQFLKEVSVRFAGENHLRTQKNIKQSSAQRFLNDPFPKKNGVQFGKPETIPSNRLIRANLSRKGFCRDPRGVFPNKVLGELTGDLLVDFLGLF